MAARIGTPYDMEPPLLSHSRLADGRGKSVFPELHAPRVFVNSSKQMSREAVPAVAKTSYE
jgi:hypothetical protein